MVSEKKGNKILYLRSLGLSNYLLTVTVAYFYWKTNKLSQIIVVDNRKYSYVLRRRVLFLVWGLSCPDNFQQYKESKVYRFDLKMSL